MDFRRRPSRFHTAILAWLLLALASSLLSPLVQRIPAGDVETVILCHGNGGFTRIVLSTDDSGDPSAPTADARCCPFCLSTPMPALASAQALPSSAAGRHVLHAVAPHGHTATLTLHYDSRGPPAALMPA
ncbi:DUF2946 family protein [Lautropia mirabilis]|uniref:DUF2946 family protein n=1 Tax=Lautropia mirabilis TaxID=47671 RepID=UPI0028E2CBD3|nr:DUF2946 family protein [Lautropia mirabilis]